MTVVDPQEFEANWWGDCIQSFGEEAKQITYAHRMGLVNEPQDGKWPVYDLQGKSVLDLGGGPVSLLLKTVDGGWRTVVDPCPYPEWVEARYEAAGIRYVRTEAETADVPSMAKFDECWIYNVLQHVVDPKAVIETARRYASTLRIFEWVEMEPCEGHPHKLHAYELDAWIVGTGSTEYVNENGAVGLAYYGEFAL